MVQTIFHIDVNSAYLSWQAAYQLQKGDTLDLRTIPSVIGGDPKKRHGIVLAKSVPAKTFKIQTGEPIYSATQKCPNLTIVPPNYDLYVKCSDAMINLLYRFSPKIQRYSIDECFLDLTHITQFGSPIEAAHLIKHTIETELGFTVNIGISSNKLLAKMASDFSKPNKVHTLYPDEVEEKMWPLPVRDLFMVGSRTEKKLKALGIFTIGELAKMDKAILYSHFKSHGNLIWHYANGLETSPVRAAEDEIVKGLGNSTTTPFDIYEAKTAHHVILSLVETLGMRLRKSELCCGLISIHIKNEHFLRCSHQKKLSFSTDCTEVIYQEACKLFNELWDGTPLRQLGVHVTDLSSNEFIQVSFLEPKKVKKLQALDQSIDQLRFKYGNHAIIRGCFLESGLKPLNGGTNGADYPMVTSLL